MKRIWRWAIKAIQLVCAEFGCVGEAAHLQRRRGQPIVERAAQAIAWHEEDAQIRHCGEIGRHRARQQVRVHREQIQLAERRQRRNGALEAINVQREQRYLRQLIELRRQRAAQLVVVKRHRQWPRHETQLGGQRARKLVRAELQRWKRVAKQRQFRWNRAAELIRHAHLQMLDCRPRANLRGQRAANRRLLNGESF